MASGADLAWSKLFANIDRKGMTLQRQIRQCLVSAIEGQILAAETRLPSSRKLADTLGIARNTVVLAYQQLIDEGYLFSRDRSGIFVASSDLCPAPPLASLPKTTTGSWAGRFAVQPSAFRQIVKPRNWMDYPYPFLFGQSDPQLFPTNDWRESVRAASSVAEISAWAGDMIDEDDPELVEQVRAQILPRRGIWAAAGEVMITIGAQQALSLVTQLLVGRNTPTGVENPGYPDVRHIVSLSTSDLRLLRVDSHGVVPDEALKSCRVVFITASHQCPTTVAMPFKRRQELLSAAQAHDIFLVEDDYEADVFQEGGELPPLKSQDGDGRIVYIGSLSKVLAPGLRIGYVVAPKEVICDRPIFADPSEELPLATRPRCDELLGHGSGGSRRPGTGARGQKRGCTHRARRRVFRRSS